MGGRPVGAVPRAYFRRLYEDDAPIADKIRTIAADADEDVLAAT